MGEAAYLSKHKDDLQSSFYKAVPGKLEWYNSIDCINERCPSMIFNFQFSSFSEEIFWPVFLIATLATVVGSQAIISATFSLISQSRALGCFPRVKIVHTSNNIHGQIYIPEVNWLLMLLCLAVVSGFRDTAMIANAYGLHHISFSSSYLISSMCILFTSLVILFFMYRSCCGYSYVRHDIVDVFGHQYCVESKCFMGFPVCISIWICGIVLFLCMHCQRRRRRLAFPGGLSSNLDTNVNMALRYFKKTGV